MSRTEPRRSYPADAGVYVLSEGPFWSPASGRLSWVDIEVGRVLTAPLEPLFEAAVTVGPVASVELPGKVGFVVESESGTALIGLDRSLAVLDRSGHVARSAPLLAEGRRFNDGKVDPQGRLVVGSLTLSGSGHGNVLLRLESDGSITVLDDDLGLSNGLGWSPDGGWFYSIDTDARTVYRRSYGADAVGERKAFIHVDTDGWPDGMSIDAEGNLWIAIWGEGEVRVFDVEGMPRDDLGVTIDAPHCSSVAFAGTDLDVLVMTSASRDLDTIERTRWPDAGGLFIARSPVSGLPMTPWIDAPLPAAASALDHSDQKAKR